ncbi:MAG TPA: phosphotransferase [Candidatus Dormibacteraeota bacterium]|nr:phosphotransferase [Candidatus Dormibacteraeota bacterium]
MEEATDKASVSAFVEEVLAGTGWELQAVRRRSSRFEPPDWYWTQFEITINKGDEERRLRLVAKGALNPAAWERLSERLMRHGAGRSCDPIDGLGYPKLFPESRHAYWFYPFDPTMPSLPSAADPVRRAGVLLGLQGETADILAASRRLNVQRVRYVPEVGAILRYTMDTAATKLDVYGKVQPGNRGRRTFRIVEGLWEAAKQYPGFLNLPRPLGFIEEFGLLLEERVRGRPVGGNRMSAEFMLTGNAAAEALAVIHESKLATDGQIKIDNEIARLDRVAEQFKYVLPVGHFLLTDLIAHMRDRVRKTSEEAWLPTHGDMKYDQFIHHNGELTLLDFDYFALAETSYDLGKFCAYTIPSSPKSWQDSVAAENTRRLFLERYMELRPEATLQRFGVYEALQLALRAMAFMWAQSSGWERVAETFLVMAFERLKSRLPE